MSEASEETITNNQLSTSITEQDKIVVQNPFTATNQNPPQNFVVVPVQPKSIFVKFVRIDIYQVVLNWGFRSVCSMLDENKQVICNQDVVIEGDDYNNWTNDDEMIQLILSKIGLLPEQVVVL